MEIPRKQIGVGKIEWTSFHMTRKLQERERDVSISSSWFNNTRTLLVLRLHGSNKPKITGCQLVCINVGLILDFS